MNLIIVESPTKARTLTRFLGTKFMVEATMGHIMDLPKSKIGVDIENNFKPEYVVMEGKEKVIKEIKKLSEKVDKVFLATDPDREGEAISSHVKDVLQSNNKLKRIVFHEITKEAVDEAIKNPRDIDVNLVDAQIGRRVLDRLVGYKLSPLLWRKVRRGLSAGRVQTVTVRLIVEREREILAFKTDEYWEIFATVKQLNSSAVNSKFIVQLIKIGDQKAEIKDQKTAETVTNELKTASYAVLDVKKREVRKNPYPPFTTSTMTQAGVRIFGWSAKKTMMIAQRLYEGGLITYHRTDSTNIAAVAIQNTREFIGKNYGNNYLPPTPRFYKTKSKVAQEAHEAVRPTKLDTIFNFHRKAGYSFSISNEVESSAKKLYELIWKRFVACQMAAAVYDETTIDVTAEQVNSLTVKLFNRYLLRASGQIMKFDGWRKLYQTEIETEIEKLPEVQKDEQLTLIKVDPQQKFTQPPARYNEASLIKTLEKLGIGRPSTYAPTINTIQIRNYVEKEDRAFKPTNIGLAVNDFLIANFPDLFEYKFTAHMEDNLDKIANGEIKWTDVILEFWNPFSGKLASVQDNAARVKIETEKLGKACPECNEARLAGDESRQGELVIRTGRFGKFISCSRFPDCKYTEKLVEKTGIVCPVCKQGDVIIKKSKKGRKFYGCSRYPECKFASWQKPNKGDIKTDNIS
ncbi:DNA topoisomerase I [Candidatus Woesebacteria bacterium RIFCSPHIGHO2_02_FULL_38_9]|uniref:DNA topoisomerase 1 n=1 Tax=Candidatus Woesebacteria bacterium RIFCSPHIGHO2_01_FULL_39_28 TaxID=1802496 RepID=A0A1F7YFN3_9BACT|nr:MAG: DNA topoisomerase I [Candidatus Woesebacteria bacterium RIFCSPHIGHO2_01_FULL_39_28]OGM35327.1 MAG: DNA topoisomerase I [Candidatus Woesebacteria bacterium RIFCSPHIGHO2_02_FULL_38_9]OGM58551.1 MAG: DNA topoisomerase I [Candidatus Woesebacteria bacterium RIFCSPLOWO2_01_FULL_38_20]